MRGARARMAFLATVVTVLSTAASAAHADDVTLGHGPLRQNSDTAEPGLTALTVGTPAFTQAWRRTLAGTTAATPNQIYAQPLVVNGLGSAARNGLVVTATEDDQVAALYAGAGGTRWQRSLGTPWTPTPTCGDLVPHIGVTSTPVYDAATRTVYLVAKAAGADAAHPTIKVHALDVLTGAERPHFPLTVSGRSTNGGRTFDPATSNQRPGLLLSHGALYIGFASHCDHGPFVGFVGRVALPTAAHPAPSLSMWTTEQSDPNGQAGIWQSGGGIMSDGVDAAGRPRLFIATGNGLGVAPPPGPGTSPPGDLAESVVRLAVRADGTMAAADFFSPTTNRRLDQDDADLGSGAPVALPDSYGLGGHSRLLVIAGKDGVVRLLDRDALGGVAQGPGGADAVVDSVRGAGVWGHAAVFDGGPGSRLLYLAPSAGGLEALRVAPDADGTPQLSTVATTTQTFGFGSGSPVVTSDGGDPSTALVWLVGMDGPNGANSRLVAYPAVPPATGAWTPVASFPLPTMAKFVQPATSDGRVVLGTRTGQVLAFAAPTPALSARPVDLGAVTVGASTSGSVTLTATRPVTVRSVAVTGSSDISASAPALPRTLAAGATLSVPVRFTPSAAGLRAARLTVGTDAGTALAAVRGTGTATGGVASPGSLDLGRVAVGQSGANGVLIQNTGDAPITLTSDATLSGSTQFAVDGALPRAGTVIGPRGSLSVSVRFSPTATGPADATLTITGSSDGATGSLQVPVSGTGFTGQPALALSESVLDYGNIAPGGSGVASFKVLDAGTATMEITKAAVPAAPFVVPAPIAEGQLVQPGGTVYAQVFARPLTAMPRTDVYAVSIAATGDGTAPAPGNSPQHVTFTVNTHPWTAPIVGRAGCPVVSGAAVVLGSCRSSAASVTRTAGGYLHAGGATGACLQVHGGARTAGTVVEVGACGSGSTARTWTISSRGTLVDNRSGLCLRPRGGATAAGTRLVVDRCTSAVAEQWDLSGLLAQRGALSSGLAGLGALCASRRGSSSTVELATCTLGPGQVVTHIGATLRVAGACLTRSGRGVALQQCAGSATQAWTADTAGRLVSGGACLTAPAARTGTALTSAPCGGAAGQRWTLPDAPQAR